MMISVMATLLLVSILLLQPISIASSSSIPSRGGDEREEGKGSVEGSSSKDVECSKGYIQVYQSKIMTRGIPMYRVEILNKCPSGCSISQIHLSCGQFASSTLVNPTVFKRLNVDDCLVNDGHPLLTGHVLAFTYSNTFPYPLSVSSLSCSP